MYGLIVIFKNEVRNDFSNKIKTNTTKKNKIRNKEISKTRYRIFSLFRCLVCFCFIEKPRKKRKESMNGIEFVSSSFH